MEWYRIRKNRSPDWRRRRDRFHSLELIFGLDPASATFVDLFDGSLMGNPSFVEVTRRSPVSSEVVVKLATNSRHSLLEAHQLISEVLHSVVQDIELRSLHTNHLSKVIGLKTRLVDITNRYTTKTRTLDFSCLSIHQRRSTMSRLDHLSNEAISVG